MSELAYYPLGWRTFTLAGPDRKSFLHGLVTSDVKGLQPGRELPSCLLTPKGKVQAHFWTYEEKERLLLLCPAETAEALWSALNKMVMLSESKLEDLSARWKVFFRSGAASERGLPFSVLDGALILLEPETAPGARTMSAEEFERRRIERGLPRFGVDMDADTIPLEARLDSAISFNKGCYMGQETISRIHHLGHVNKLLVGLRFDGPPPKAPAPVLKDGKEVGRLTSVTPLGEGGLGLATVRREDSASCVLVEAGGRKAVVLDLWTAPQGA